jgi:hypothetical protein
MSQLCQTVIASDCTADIRACPTIGLTVSCRFARVPNRSYYAFACTKCNVAFSIFQVILPNVTTLPYSRLRCLSAG